MKIENQELIQKFYEQNKEKYGHLSLEQVKECAFTQYNYARKEIESGRLPAIRLKYLGTFLVYEKRAITMLETLKVAFSDLRIEAKKYFETKAMLENFLINEEEKKIK